MDESDDNSSSESNDSEAELDSVESEGDTPLDDGDVDTAWPILRFQKGDHVRAASNGAEGVVTGVVYPNDQASVESGEAGVQYTVKFKGQPHDALCEMHEVVHSAQWGGALPSFIAEHLSADIDSDKDDPDYDPMLEDDEEVDADHTVQLEAGEELHELYSKKRVAFLHLDLEVTGSSDSSAIIQIACDLVVTNDDSSLLEITWSKWVQPHEGAEWMDA